MYILADSTFDKDGIDYGFHMKNYAVRAGILHTVYLDGEQDILPSRTFASGNLTVWDNKLIYMGSPVWDLTGLDYAIFNSPVDISKVGSGKSKILLGGQIGKRRRAEMNKRLAQNHIPHYDLSESFFRF